MPPAPPGERYEDLIEVFTVLSRTLAEDESVHDTLQSILALALRLVPGCTAASVTVLDEQGKPGTIAATDDETRELDRRQYLLQDGPCLDAARRQQVNRWTLAEAEQHWPDFTSLAKELGLRSRAALESGDLVRFGELMHEHWEHKKRRSGKMSNEQIDEWYQLARRSGAIGGKLVGAGGGGFLMFYARDRNLLRHAMTSAGLEEVRFKFDFEGTKLILT